MMETVIGVPKQPYSPHLKKVLKTYQLSAVKSLQGPSTVLGSSSVSNCEKDMSSKAGSTLVPIIKTEIIDQTPGQSPESLSPAPEVSGVHSDGSVTMNGSDVFLTPPPFPIQQLPILTTPDQSWSERSETILEGETISCFVVGGEKRLCLPQVLNSVLRDFTLPQINQVCDDLQIYCSRCNPEQLEVLKVTGILPMTAPSCGLITKTDAERLCSALLHRTVGPQLLVKSENRKYLSFKVYHECFGKCKGICIPELYTDRNARCIECVECNGMFSPQRFVCHAHRALENRTCHWGFDSSNWRSYLLIAKDQEEHENLVKLLNVFKEQHDHSKNSANNSFIKRKQVLSAEFDCKESLEQIALKKPKLEMPEAYSSMYPIPSDYHMCWFEWGRDFSRASAFRPWPSVLTKDGKPVLRDSLPTPVPPYLSHSPPVLLHPERVVPMSESQRFERTFQPNVALAPHHKVHSKSEVKSEVVDRKPVCVVAASEKSQLVSLPSTVPPSSKALLVNYNPEIELSTDTDDSSSDVTAEMGGESKFHNAVEQVSTLLSNVNEAKDNIREQIVTLVQNLVHELSEVRQRNEKLRQRLGTTEDKNEDLRRQVAESEMEKERLTGELATKSTTIMEHESRIRQQEERIAQLQERLSDERDSITKDPEAFQDKMLAMEKELKTLRNEMTNNRRSWENSRLQSPVSVITSSPTTIKSEPLSE